jgi:hypothetical protein
MGRYVGKTDRSKREIDCSKQKIVRAGAADGSRIGYHVAVVGFVLVTFFGFCSFRKT